jgi:hypothetical protein
MQPGKLIQRDANHVKANPLTNVGVMNKLHFMLNKRFSLHHHHRILAQSDRVGII